MVSGKRLAEELAELASSAPGLDPEADAFDAGPVLPQPDEEDVQTSKGGRQERGLLMRDAISMSKRHYSGKRVSREEFSASASVPGSDNLRLSDVGVEGLLSDEEEECFKDTCTAEITHAPSRERSSSEDDAHTRNTSSGMMVAAKGRSPGVHADQVHIDVEYGVEASEEEEAELRAVMSRRAAADAMKGRGVASQQTLSITFAECRVILQQGVLAANRMPQGFLLEEAVSCDQCIAESVTTLAQSCAKALDDLHEFQASLSKHCEHSTQPRDRVINTPQGAGLAQQWQILDAGWFSQSNYVAESIDRWHRKTMLGVGARDVRSKLRSLTQTPAEHVKSMMSDPSKWVERTKLVVGAAGRVGVDQHLSVEPYTLDAETFDDRDFYQLLLKDYLQSKLGTAAPAANPPSKRQKTVERRASKGRKLRFDSHEKLVGFMTPVEQTVPSFAPQVLGSLFGKH